MFQWVDANIQNIKFFFITNTDVAAHKLSIQDRLQSADTIDGTRSYHLFRPYGNSKIELYSLSTDSTYVLKDLCEFKGLFIDLDDVKPNVYVAAVFEERWCVSLVLEIFREEGDVKVKSMHNSVGKNAFFWPNSDDVFFVPFTHIVGFSEVPILSGRSGRNSYKIDTKLFNEFEKKMAKLLKKQ